MVDELAEYRVAPAVLALVLDLQENGVVTQAHSLASATRVRRYLAKEGDLLQDSWFGRDVLLELRGAQP